MRRIAGNCILLALIAPHCVHAQWNDPRHLVPGKTGYSSFVSPPKTLDPARSYSGNEIIFNAQIYEPPLQYDYLARPYQLRPLTVARMPTVTYLNQAQQVLASDQADTAAFTRYDFTLRDDIRYQPHIAFAPKPILSSQLHTVADCLQPYTRHVRAQDYVYGIKRLAAGWVSSPIYGIMSHYIVGLRDLHQRLRAAQKTKPRQWIDLRQFSLAGVKASDDRHFSITIRGQYPPFLYWLAMPFFAPIPWEADQLYAQPGMRARNLSWEWLPVGSGPYYLAVNEPYQRMILQRNPYFHSEYLPLSNGRVDKSKPLPRIDNMVYHLEKESIPSWNKFLQGYVDLSGISADSFQQAIQLRSDGQPVLTPRLKKQGVRLQTSVAPSTFYIGFNMLDPIVGGLDEQHTKLRQALAIAVNYEDYIAIFLNGRGIPAQSLVPPNILSTKTRAQTRNSIIYQQINGHAQRRPLSAAKKLLREAGYADGINPKTHKPLILHFDTTGSGSPEDNNRYAWYRQQFAKLGIQLDVRATRYNRFQDKVRTGHVQLFNWGWGADYPDAENFLFLLFSKNGKRTFGGENATNYHNAEFDALFNKIERSRPSPKRSALITQAIKISQHDMPMLFGFHPINYSLSHQWRASSPPNSINNNTLKYQRIDTSLRQSLIAQWNRVQKRPFWLFVLGILCVFLPLLLMYRHRQRRSSIQRIPPSHEDKS